MKPLSEIFHHTIGFLKNTGSDYLVIGGVACAVSGYPRMTQDVDICIFIDGAGLDKLLESAGKDGFTFEAETVKRMARETGTFQLKYSSVPIDFIIASTEFEQKALERKISLPFLNTEAFFPSAEDLVIFKIIAGRQIDKADIINILKMKIKQINREYTMSWARKLADESGKNEIFDFLDIAFDKIAKGD